MNVDPRGLPRAGVVDRRFQSYNIEMVEVTGGDFWKPYETGPTEITDVNPRAYLPPRDLASRRLRALARELGPAYVRVSGTAANSTYFADSNLTPAAPPPGFAHVLTRDQWSGVVDFARATDAEIVTSFAVSPGTRDGRSWTTDLALRWLNFTTEIGGRIAAAEFMNEPNIAAIGGAPVNYTAEDYGRDTAAFTRLAERAAPGMAVMGPGSVGETPGPWQSTLPNRPGILKTADLLAAAGPGLDVFTYHHYGAASRRCAPLGLPQTTADAALSEEWLARTSLSRAYYGSLRDRFHPGAPLWLTETAQSACGGDAWAGNFRDCFRYTDQLGRLAREGVQVVMHNTLAASDYGLLDGADYSPKPNYWAALLWRRLMGETVLDSGVPTQHGLHLYAHSHPATPGGVSLLAINNDSTASRTLTLPTAAERFTLSAQCLDATMLNLNNQPLRLSSDGSLPEIAGAATEAGELSLAPETITFLAIPGAGNRACTPNASAIHP